jgi:hypothetical protein
MRPAKRYVNNPNPLRDVMGSWLTRRILIGVQCASCGVAIEVDVVRLKRIENLPSPNTTLVLARQALRKHAAADGCAPTPEPLRILYRSAESPQ